MAQYAWDNCPIAIKRQVIILKEDLQTLLGTNLIGLYLHGSLAMGSFNLDSSDLDLLVVTAVKIPVEIKRQIAELLLQSSMAPRPIEISFLVEQEMHPFQHPLPFDLHYSESWREKYERALANREWITWNDAIQKDHDLAVHLAVTLNRGICLFGKPAKQTFPSIPTQYYQASIIGDFKDAYTNRASMPVYFVLNACRVYAFQLEGNILSKDEGGLWGLRLLPAEYHHIIQQALDLYRGNHINEQFDEIALDRFAAFMDQHIQDLAPYVQPT